MKLFAQRRTSARSGGYPVPRMRGLKRQISPGAAAFLVVVVLAIVQWVWWRGLVYKAPPPPPGPPRGGPPPFSPDQVVVEGRKYVAVETYAGDAEPGEADGLGYIARFDRPTGIALDRSGMLYVCDTGNHRIRKVASDGTVSTLAGSEMGFADGPVAAARFNAPCGICTAPDGAIYVADTGNGRIRRIKDGMVTTVVAGSVLSTLPAKEPLFVNVSYVQAARPLLVVSNCSQGALAWYDTTGALVTTKPHNNTAAITDEDLNPAGTNSEVAPVPIPIEGTEELADVARRPVLRHTEGWSRLGTGALVTDGAHASLFLVKNGKAEVLAGFASSSGPMPGFRDGTGDKAQFYQPSAVTTDGVKFAYVADTGNNCIRRLTLPDFLFH